ncbi:MAG: hypothetical protein QG549_481, partial [Patescibacteria group bacterium]|nr:hypothetical protein [Patescibacteria group bacterium]
IAIVAIALTLSTLFVPSKIPSTSELVPLYSLSDAKKFKSPKDLIDSASEGLHGEVRLATSETIVGLDDDGYAVYKLPAYTVPGKKFSNYPVKGAGIALTGDASQSESNYDKLIQFFTVNSFKRVMSNKGGNTNFSDNTEVPLLYSAIYKSKDIFCTVWRADISKVKPATQMTSVGCADTDSYITASSSIDPFYVAYSKDRERNVEGLVFGTPFIANSADEYRRATLFQETTDSTSFIGLYYQTPNSSTWNYFGRETTKSGELTACSAYTAPEIKKAFKGLECYDTTAKKNTTVQ